MDNSFDLLNWSDHAPNVWTTVSCDQTFSCFELEQEIVFKLYICKLSQQFILLYKA